MHIRAARHEDIPSITLLAKELLILHLDFDHDYYQLHNKSDEELRIWITNQINSVSQFVLVAEVNDGRTIVGFITGYIKPLYPWFHHKQIGQISHLVVSNKHRRKNVGKYLEAAAISWFRKKSVSYIEVYTDEKNTVGQIAWNSYNYKPFKKYLRKKI